MTREELERLAESVRNSDPEELWDLYDAHGLPTGRTQRRGEQLKEGDFHLCVHVWLQDEAGRYLLTRRAPGKYMAGCWETPGGSALAGEDSLAAALREVREETGLTLDPAAGERLFRFSGDRFHCDVWLFRQHLDPAWVTLCPGETCGVRLADAEAIRRLEKAGELFAFDYLERVLARPEEN